MQVNVRNYRGCDRAEVEPAPIALLAGSNGVGKTSILEAAAGALAGEPVPVYAGEKPALKKKDAGDLVGPFGKRGKAVVTGESGNAQVNWPGAKAGSEGTPPQASALATGLIDWPGLAEKRRAALLGAMIQAEPTFEDLASAITDELGHEAADGSQVAGPVWQEIQEQGWDPAHKAYKDVLARKKGQWEETTGERWGRDKGEDWEPESWTTDLAEKSLEELDLELANAQQREADARAGQAMDAERQRKLQAEAADLAPAQEEKQAAEQEHHQAQELLQKLRHEYQAMAAQPDAYCPDCGTALAITAHGGGGGYEVGVSDEEPADAEILQAKAEGLTAQQNRVQAAKDRIAEANGRIQRAGNAQSELEAIPEQGDSGDDPDAAREAAAQARHRRDAKKAKDRADQLHNEILTDQAIAAALDPEGVRRQALVRALDRINKEYLAPLSAGWAETVWLSEDFTAYYGQRPFYLLSLSEAYRVRVTMRIALAALDGSEAVVLDGADVLDSAGRNHLIQVLMAATRADWAPGSYLVGITLNRRDQVPGLAKAGLGRSYWVQGGTVERLEADQQGAA